MFRKSGVWALLHSNLSLTLQLNPSWNHKGGGLALGCSPPGLPILQLWPFCEPLLFGKCFRRKKKKRSNAHCDFHAFHCLGAKIVTFFPCSSLRLPFPGPSNSRMTHQNTNTLTLWLQSCLCVTSVRQERPWKVTAALMLQQSVRLVQRSILQRIGTGEIHASSAPQYVSVCSAILFSFWKDSYIGEV